jgi:hypothetical protein
LHTPSVKVVVASFYHRSSQTLGTPKTASLVRWGGVYLEVSPAGGRWWRLEYRFGGKERRLSRGGRPRWACPDVDLKIGSSQKASKGYCQTDQSDDGPQQVNKCCAPGRDTVFRAERTMGASPRKTIGNRDDEQRNRQRQGIGGRGDHRRHAQLDRYPLKNPEHRIDLKNAENLQLAHRAFPNTHRSSIEVGDCDVSITAARPNRTAVLRFLGSDRYRNRTANVGYGPQPRGSQYSLPKECPIYIKSPAPRIIRH